VSGEEIHFGDAEGEVCWRNGCRGVIALHPHKGCSCHIHPPCADCSEPKEYCPDCDWQAVDDVHQLNDHIVKYVDRSHGVAYDLGLRPLDPRKLDYHNKSHTNFSMIKEGVYPEGMTSAEVRARVNGTFGGRFEYFFGGRFKFIAYTD